MESVKHYLSLLTQSLLILLSIAFCSISAAEPAGEQQNLLTHSPSTSTLTRSSFLGLIPQSAQLGDAVVIDNLHPQGTAQALELKQGDTLLSINDKPIADFPELVAILNTIDAGMDISVTVKRNEKPITLTAVAQSRPLETGKDYDVEYGEFGWQQERIRTITYHPDKRRKDNAAVLFIQGYTCGSIDYGMLPDVSLTQLLGRFADAGFTVMKMEKPGVGDSQGQLDCQTYDFNVENAAFVAGLKHLKQQANVNSSNVFVFGHSLGVLHASIIAEQGLAKGVIGYGGVAKPWIDYVHDIYSKQSTKYWGVSNEQAKKNLETISPFLNLWLGTDQSWAQIASSPAAKKVVAEDLLALGDEQILNRHFSFFRSVNQHNFQQKWANTKAHALMLHGEYDVQAISGDWIQQVKRLVNENTAFSSQTYAFERTDHGLMQYQNKEELMKATRGQARGLGRFNQNIASKSLRWMEDLLAINAD
ncbi:PDZ domain-containing protein [Thalassotalea sp. M1531]|uniref:PDZ domain-containing protein n=1 Tax=Thalassotalea algicola TaxID=2716224 RepID=A0A7Y0Q859_9GAMM|nr:PDZ domain-containing protein [Thalassotalea algicola]NMP33123.1 PDZ domain-containing protein [Thalassotalea algicola]